MDTFAFTEADWRAVRLAPWIVANAVIDADPSGPIVTRRELLSVFEMISSTAAANDRRPLVRAIAKDLDAHHGDGPTHLQASTWQDRLSETLGIVDAKAPGPDGRDLRDWLYEVATTVADAASDRLRLTGPALSPADQRRLEELRMILGIG